MLHIQINESANEINFENRTTDNNKSAVDQDIAIRERINGEDATETDLSNSRQSDNQTKSEASKTSEGFNKDDDENLHSSGDGSDKGYFHPSENAIREKLNVEDNDPTVKDVENFEHFMEGEECTTELSKVSDKAIREYVGINNEDATVNDISNLSNGSSPTASSDFSASSSFLATQTCSCTEKDLCAVCFKKYASEFIDSIEQSLTFPNATKIEDVDKSSKQISSSDVDES